MSLSLLRAGAGARAAVVAAGDVIISLGGTLAADAHVSVSADTTAAGSYALLTFSVPHGCDGSATTKIAVKIPDQVTSVTPTVNPNWDVQTVTEALNPPITDSDGDQITERVDQVIYTAKTPLAADLRDSLTLSVAIPETAAGQTLPFPVIQTCEASETPWIEQSTPGQPDPAHPAPSIGSRRSCRRWLVGVTVREALQRPGRPHGGHRLDVIRRRDGHHRPRRGSTRTGLRRHRPRAIPPHLR